MAPELDPSLFAETLFAFVRSGVLKAAVDLDLFDHVAAGKRTAAEIAAAADARERAVRILLDVLAAHGLLGKEPGGYVLGPLAEMLLVRRSPTFIGDFTRITANPRVWDGVGRLAEIARTGEPYDATVETAGHAFWEEFSEASHGASRLPAGFIAGLLGLEAARPAEVLDVACGSGAYGFAVLEQYPQARVTALDWENVLAHARIFAERRGLAARVTWVGGSAFDVPLAPGRYDAIVASHFYHHFSQPENVALSRRLFAALKPGGRLAVHEWVPDDARARQQVALDFAVLMLATTRDGDTYTLAEYRAMLGAAGFGALEIREVSGVGSQVIVARRPD